MLLFRSFLVLTLALIVSGCASLTGPSDTRQTEAILANRKSWPETAHVAGVPFIQQSEGHCGPATLTMALQFYGKKISVEELAPQVFTPGVKGSFQADMVSASRRQGMMAIPIQGMEALLTEIAAGHPVVVFENLALPWLPQWHYAIVFGYDLQAQTVRMHSGPEASKNWDLHKFERSWMLADYWGLVVLPPGELSMTADELSHVQAASALETLGKLPEAKKAYSRILEKWPRSLAASIGNANIAYKEGEPEQAIRFLENAVKYHPQAGIAWHNLTVAYGAGKKTSKARESAKQAVQWATADEKPTFTKNLKAWL